MKKNIPKFQWVGYCGAYTDFMSFHQNDSKSNPSEIIWKNKVIWLKKL